MEITHNYRPWDELIPDILGIIFKRLPLRVILNVVPSVCKSWAKATRGPYCWQEIDIMKWSQCRHGGWVDRMLSLLVGRSSGTLQKLCVYGLTKFGSSLICDNANNLRILQLPGSQMSNSMVEQIAGKLTSLTYLDLSCCTKIDAQAIEVIGKHCQKLTDFRRNMYGCASYLTGPEDTEAFAIAATMPQLKHLLMTFRNVTTKRVLRILTKCCELERLDIRGCWKVKLETKLLKKRPKLKVVGPRVIGSCRELTQVYQGRTLHQLKPKRLPIGRRNRARGAPLQKV